MSWYHYESTRTREAKGGIRALSRRGGFGSTWWGRRWIETLEGFDMGARLTRGRSYARKGQVLSIDVEQGRVEATVLGSRPTPYAVTIRLAAYPDDAWAEVGASLRRRPFFAARLLADALPPEIEAVFAAAGLSLFPQREADLETDCSCPDWSNPCKHIAAVYCLLAEAFDRDPFLLFRLRGLSREALLAHVLGARASAKTDAEPEAPSVPLDPGERFWSVGPLPTDLAADLRPPPVSAALPRRLGGFPFWRAETPMLSMLEPLYPSAARRARALLEDDEGAENRRR